MPIYRPRMEAVLTVPDWGESVDGTAKDESESHFSFPVQLSQVTLTRNDHNQADVAELVVDWQDTGVDARLLSNAGVQLYVGNADERNIWRRSEKDLQFVGFATKVERTLSSLAEFASQSIITAHDLTTRFLETKPYPPKGIPTYGMTLDQAWRTIVSHTRDKFIQGKSFMSAKVLTDRLVQHGLDGWPKLGVSEPKRRASDPIPIPRGADAWAVWQTCCAMVGVISWIDRYNVVVKTPASMYSSDDTPRLIWGRNISSITEKRNSSIAAKSVRVTSYDFSGKRVVESIHRTKAGQANPLQDECDVYQIDSVADKRTLDEIARRIYEERSRHEFEGTMVTSDWGFALLTTN